MRRLFSLLFLALISISVYAEWIYTTESDEFTAYVNTDISKESSGDYIVWVKWEINSKALNRKRKELRRRFRDSKYLNSSYYIEMVKFDLRNNKSKSCTMTWYNASGKVIDNTNIEYYSDWEYPMPDSLGDDIMKMVKILVSIRESDN